jgi:hypothetical protein
MTSTLVSVHDSWTKKKELDKRILLEQQKHQRSKEKIYQQEHSLRGCALPAYNLHYITQYHHHHTAHASRKNEPKLMKVYSKLMKDCEETRHVNNKKQSTSTRTN